MKAISIEELKVIQMNILDAVDKFCAENNIRYSLACGSMLGAVRHKGYIPWDDDIDIYLLRDDYEKLMSLFPEIYEDYYCIYSLERNVNWDRPIAKAFDNRTIVVEKAYCNEQIGVNIDIFPVDEVPEDKVEWKKYDHHRRLLYKKYARSCYYFPWGPRFKDYLTWIKFALYRFLFPRRKMAKAVDNFCQKWRGRGYQTVFESCMGIFSKQPFNKEVFDRIIDYPFEDRVYKGFENYDEYLRNNYGDYMTLPPEEERVTHHDFEAYWK